jgi:hypothetical protein
VTLEQSAEENAHSPSIQQAMVRNSDVPEVDEQALGARSPVRVVWPLAVSEIPPEAAGTTVAAKNESVQPVRPEAHVETTGQAESSVQPREGTTESLGLTPSMVVLFLAIGLPWVGVLAWLGITASSARGERPVRNYLQLKATGHLDYNKRGVNRLDDQREANRMDDFLANLAQSLTTRPRSAAFASAQYVPPNQEAIEAACARLVALRHRVGRGVISATHTTEVA